MDKRWICILIIAIVGFAGLYYIVDNSSTLESASVYVNKFKVTLPHDYNVAGDGKTYMDAVNKQTNEHIIIKDVGKGDLISSEFAKRADALINNENISSTEYSSIEINCENLTTIEYKSISNDNINKIIFLTKDDHTFTFECKDFHNETKLENDVSFLMDTLMRDVKQKQDE